MREDMKIVESGIGKDGKGAYAWIKMSDGYKYRCTRCKKKFSIHRQKLGGYHNSKIGWTSPLYDEMKALLDKRDKYNNEIAISL